MGPAIIFDKSVLQSLGRSAIHEANRYLYTVIPDVLLHEILADLSLDPEYQADPKARVKVLARKVSFANACASLNFRKMCINDLLGNYVPMDRCPVVDAKTVNILSTKDGQSGTYRGVQPENDAVLRWGGGVFSTNDLEFAALWREYAEGTNLAALKQQFPKPPIEIRSLEDVNTCVDLMFREPEFQTPLLLGFLRFLAYDKQICDRVCFRWQLAVVRSLNAFAPYALHCLRVYLFYYIGIAYGLLSTKPNTIVDLEYLCHAPFANVFCSDDKVHRRMAQFILKDDQTFIDGKAMKMSLDELVTARKTDANAVPHTGSLIHNLWLKHRKTSPAQAGPRVPTEEESSRLREAVKSISEAIGEHQQQGLPRRFPV